MKKYIFLIITLLGGFLYVFAQIREPLRRSTEQYCVVCHASWSIGADSPASLIPEVSAYVMVDGKPSQVSNEKICFSCHAGYVSDSRDFFLENDTHKERPNLEKIKHGKLPVDSRGQMYCGTCHTPHSSLMVEKTIYKPFLREKIRESQICLQCHDELAVKSLNHPLHVKKADFPANLSHAKLAPGQVECLSCHVMHHRKQTKLVRNKDRSPLCSSCHKDHFDMVFSDHDLRYAEGSVRREVKDNFQYTDVCSGCHLTHKGKAQFMWSQTIPNSNSLNQFCLDCHSSNKPGRAKSFTHQGHPVSGRIFKKAYPELSIEINDSLYCISCHDPHRWEIRKGVHLTRKNEEGNEFTSFLRLPDDEQGSLCITCHNEYREILISDHSIVRKGFQDYLAENNTFRGQCSVCHETHKKGFRVSADSTNPDIVMNACLDCHKNRKHLSGIGENSHPLSIPFSSTVRMKGFISSDTTLISCNTCHNPHKWGRLKTDLSTANLTGDDENSFLALSNYPNPTLCLTCHNEQKSILFTSHNVKKEGISACHTCHVAHNAATKYGIFTMWNNNPGKSFNEKLCFNCHSKGEIAEKKIPPAFTHPHEYGVVSTSMRKIGKWLDFPIFDERGPSNTVGFIDCFTCHNPHQWSYDPKLRIPEKPDEEGTYYTSYLRNPSYKSLCTDCHGDATIWKYNYYHDSVKRKRY